MSRKERGSAMKIEWKAGAPELKEAIEAALPSAIERDVPVHQSSMRALYRLPLQMGDAATASPSAAREVMIKLYTPRGGMRGLRDRAKKRLGRFAADREWNALAEMQRLGLPAPTPRARGRIQGGSEFVAMEVIQGEPLAVALDREMMRMDRAEGDANADPGLAMLVRLSDSVHALHRLGFVHGDLHAGNILASPERLVLIDLQRLCPLESDEARLADWARLCFSLERTTKREGAAAELRSLAELGPELDQAMTEFLADHQRGRVRRFHHPGGAWKRLRVSAFGTAWVDTSAESPLDADALGQLLSEDRAEGEIDVRRDGRVRIWTATAASRRFVCKRVDTGSASRAVADIFRGSSGERAFRLGQADSLISSRASRPVAWISRKTLGIPRTSWLLMEHVGETDLDAFRPASPTEARNVSFALVDWIAEQHARGLGHGDLKAGNLRIALEGDTPRFHLVDLNDLTGPSKVDEADRIAALTQLNAALDETQFEASLRTQALARYAERLPFSQPLDSVMRAIALASVDRHHRWQGIDCDCVNSV
jgi:tRNA A-37 threonylcarbamoyl transferase component Bud32